MSILLDALRKTERQQRKGSLPDIHAEDVAVEADGPPRSRTGPIWALTAIVLVVLGIYGWQAWQARKVPTAPPEFTAEDAPLAPDTPSASPREDSTAATEAGANSVEQAQAQASAPAATAASPATPGPRLDRQPRSPVETLGSERPLQPAVTRPPPEPEQASAAAPAAATASAAPSSNPGRSAAQQRRDAQIAAMRAAVETTGVPEQERPANQRGAQATNEPEDNAISVWQLPEMTRNSLPELRINVMVYDEDPSKRFIIMGGKRYLEGAKVAGNLQLETVQRDRALFRYGAYLFYVKQ